MPFTTGKPRENFLTQLNLQVNEKGILKHFNRNTEMEKDTEET